MLISPDLGVSSPSCGSCDMPEVRRGSRLRELSVPKSPSAERLLAGCPRVSLSMSKATLSVHGTLGWGNTAPRYCGNVLHVAHTCIEWNHTHTHFFSCCGCPEVTQQRNAWMNNFYLLKRRKKKQKKGLRHKEGTQVHLYHSLCLYGLPQPRQTLNSVSSSKNPGMLLTAKTDHPQNICYYFLRNV